MSTKTTIANNNLIDSPLKQQVTLNATNQNQDKKKTINLDFSDHKNFAYLAEEAYNFDKPYAKSEINGYKKLSEFDTINPQTGFQGCVYDSDNIIVISYRGTDENADWNSNLQLYNEAPPEQYNDALNLYKRVSSDNRFQNKQIVLTGHSLGGSLAELVASDSIFDKSSNVKAITFNAYGINSIIQDGTRFKDFDNCANYVIDNDIVGNLNNHPGRVGTLTFAGSGEFSFSDYHDMKQFINNEKKFEEAYNFLSTDESKEKNITPKEGKIAGSIISSIIDTVCDFFNDCGNAIASFFGFGDNKEKTYLA